jgi:beta-glucosidase-like glycosyl hydrolase
MVQDILQRLAPHMIVGLEGQRLTDAEAALLSKYAFPGVILFERNVADARQLMELTQAIRSVFSASRGIAPLIAADHEGGVVSVLSRAIGVPPTQMAAARAGETHLVERLFAENARRMRACGVNMLLGPVADVNSDPLNPVIGTRSFGEETELVSSLVAVAVAAARREGVLTCLKHFPGHGPSRVDSHLALPVLGATLDELRERDVPPFARGIAAMAESVMIGHIAPLGRALPASLDPDIIGGLLRGELGFGGVVMTDALEMEGVKGEGSLLDICARALAAGNDILLFSKPVSLVADEIASLGEASGADELRDEGFAGADAPSIARIERLLGLAGEKEREFELPSDPGAYREIAEKSIFLAPGLDVAAECPSPDGRKKDCRAIFHCEKGELDRFPTRNFIFRVLQGLKAGEGARSEAHEAISIGRFNLERYEASGEMPPHLDAWLFSTSGAPGSAPDAVFLLNRRPLPGDAVAKMCSGTGIVVVAGWPYAARFVESGRTAITTFGIYDAAADEVCRLIGGR